MHSILTTDRNTHFKMVAVALAVMFVVLACLSGATAHNQSDRTVVTSGMAAAHSGAGNLVPVW